jgi:hypothetical protein
MHATDFAWSLYIIQLLLCCPFSVPLAPTKRCDASVVNYHGVNTLPFVLDSAMRMSSITVCRSLLYTPTVGSAS